MPDDIMKTRAGYVSVRGAREHNLKNVSLDIPRDALVVFTGVSGSGKSSLAFGTLYAEAQRRYLESVSPYARRLFHQMAVPEVDDIAGLPPAVALQQQRGGSTTRSSVGSVSTLANSVRMLYSRAGDYPVGQGILYAEAFSPNTPDGACPRCHGLGRVYEVTEQSMVPDDTLTIRERAVAAWPPAWHGQNLRDILTTLGYDVDVPWRDMSKKDRDWILFTDEQPTVPVYAGFTRAEVKAAMKRKETPSYQGTFTGAQKYVLQTFATTESASMKKRVSRYMVSTECPECKGKRLQRASLSVTFGGLDIADIARLPLARLAEMLKPYANAATLTKVKGDQHPEKRIVTQRIAADLAARLDVLLALGLGYLSLERSTPTLSPGELQRLRLATQVRSNLFGVVYVLDEPSAGLHPADTEALLGALAQLKASGNSLFVVEHALDVIREADWIVDVGPAAGEQGGHVLYSGAPAGLEKIAASQTRRFLFDVAPPAVRTPRAPAGWLKLEGVTRNNLDNLSVGVSARRADRRHRRVRLRQIQPGQPGAGRTGDQGARPSAGSGRGRRGRRPRADRGGAAGRAHRRRPGQHQAPDPGRPETDRQNPPFEPGHLHRPVRPCPQAVCRDQDGEIAQIRRRALFLQCRQRPLRALRRRRLRHGRVAVLAQRLRAMPDLRRRPLQRQDPGSDIPGQEHRRSAGDDGGCRRGILRGRTRRLEIAGNVCARSGSVTCGWASRPRNCRAAKPSASSWPPNCSVPRAATCCMCWMSRPRACIRPMSNA